MKTLDISGFTLPDGKPSAYEICAQMMLRDALEYIETNKIRFKVGLYDANDEFRNQIYKIWDKYNPSGAQAGATMSHVAYIHRHGYNAWIATSPDRVIDVELEGITLERLSELHKEHMKIMYPGMS